MHYFQFNIGDYASHTRHLTRDEDLAYRRLLDLYYLQEKPLPADYQKCARLILMSECSADVERVLNEFFEPNEDGTGLINKRADAEIAKYHSKSEKAREAGKASGKVRKERTLNDRSTDAELNKKQETRNIKQEPIKNIRTAKAVACPVGLPEQVWSDFLTLRKAKKNPLTETALSLIQREAEKAHWSLEDAVRECVMRGWQSFKADWVMNKPAFNGNKQEALEARNRAVVERLLEKEASYGNH